MLKFLSCYRWPIITFIAASLLGLVGRIAVGSVYSAAEAVDLLQALARAGLYLGSAVATASATTIALMLTLTGLMRRSDEEFDYDTYRDVAMVGRASSITLLVALFLLMAFTLPVGQFEDLPIAWFDNVYNWLLGMTVFMVALSAATVTLIYTTLIRVVSTITPGDDV